MEEKYKILIIDDDSFILNLYVAKFQKGGQEVETARSCSEAFSKLKNGYVPNVVMIDVVLPDMNGLDFLSQVRTEKLAPDAVYMMVTNQNSDDETSRAKELGVAGYIIKANSTPSEVVAKVLELAKQHKK
ncbi:MAG TPA: response regulator [Candidatus Nanoarchaeia archaeon]|nr:response regulator [Candidatus Nanoarchaeia archaeon]